MDGDTDTYNITQLLPCTNFFVHLKAQADQAQLKVENNTTTTLPQGMVNSSVRYGNLAAGIRNVSIVLSKICIMCNMWLRKHRWDIPGVSKAIKKDIAVQTKHLH